MKILWHSNAPWTSSGYGKQTALFCPRIAKAGHDVAISGFYGAEGGSLEWGGLHVYPTDHSRFGNVLLADYVRHHGEGEPCLLITLMDVWVLTSGRLKDLWLASWAPIDHDPLPPRVAEFFAQQDARPIAMSRFGVEKFLEAGFEDPLYVPHAVDTEIYRMRRDERSFIRQGLGVPTDAFVVGMVAANMGTAPSRKAFPQVMQAFAEFRRRHDDAILYLHTDMLGLNRGINLVAMGDACGIPREALATTDQLMVHLGLPDEKLSGIYNAFDVLAQPSLGEGYGIPAVEAQACGIPVILNDHTAMPELLGAGWLVDGDPWYDASQGSFFKVPSVAMILDALEEAYANRDSDELAGKAREFAVQYDVDRVFSEFWLPALEALEAPREVAPLTLAK